MELSILLLNRETVELCRRAEHAGVSWITVHGRTKDQRGEPADHDAIRIIKEGVGVPVVANGDVKSMEDVRRIVEQTGVDGKIWCLTSGGHKHCLHHLPS